jgi:hypothetical protein
MDSTYLHLLILNIIRLDRKRYPGLTKANFVRALEALAEGIPGADSYPHQ